MPFRTLRVLLRRRASGTAFPRWSVRNDHLNYRATLCVVCLPDALRPLATQSVGNCILTLERRERSSQLSCDALRRMPSGRSASSCDAERRELHSHAGAFGTIISTIVRRSASYAFRTLCVLLRRRASGTAFSRWSVGNDHLNYRATLCVVCLPDALRPLATQSVENCIPTLEREEGSAEYQAPRLLGERIFPALLQSPAVRRSALQSFNPRGHVRVRLQHCLGLGELADEAHLNVRTT